MGGQAEIAVVHHLGPGCGRFAHPCGVQCTCPGRCCMREDLKVMEGGCMCVASAVLPTSDAASPLLPLPLPLRLQGCRSVLWQITAYLWQSELRMPPAWRPHCRARQVLGSGSGRGSASDGSRWQQSSCCCCCLLSCRQANHLPAGSVPVTSNIMWRCILSVVIPLQGLPASSVTRQFAADLLARVPRAGGSTAAAAAAAQRERDAGAAAMARKSQKYSLLVDDEDEGPEVRCSLLDSFVLAFLFSSSCPWVSCPCQLLCACWPARLLGSGLVQDRWEMAGSAERGTARPCPCHCGRQGIPLSMLLLPRHSSPRAAGQAAAAAGARCRGAACGAQRPRPRQELAAQRAAKGGGGGGGGG